MSFARYIERVIVARCNRGSSNPYFVVGCVFSVRPRVCF